MLGKAEVAAEVAAEAVTGMRQWRGRVVWVVWCGAVWCGAARCGAVWAGG